MVEAVLVLSVVVVLQAGAIAALVWRLMGQRPVRRAPAWLGQPRERAVAAPLAAGHNVGNPAAKKPARASGWTELKERLERGERAGEAEGAVTK